VSFNSSRKQFFTRPHLWLIRVIGVIVPCRLRADWRQEWEAELWRRERMLAEWDRLDWLNKLELLRRSASAFWDALVLQPQRLEDEMFQDLRFGARMLRRHPGFTLIAALTLALGIGANTAIFSVVNAVVLRPLPFKDADRLVVIWESNPRNKENEVSAANFIDWREQQSVFDQIAALSYANVVMTGGDEPERLQAAVVTPSFFSALGTQPGLGRAFLPEEGVPGAARAVILSHGLWRRRFAADPSIVGKQVTLSGANLTVVGVSPPDFQLQFPTNRQVDLWLPRVFSAQLSANREMHFLYVLGRLKPGVSINQAQSGMDAVAERLARQYPNTNTGAGVKLVPMQEQIVGKVRRALLILFGAVGFVLLIASANVANLTLSRAAARASEMAIRSALGASRLRVIRQSLTESMLLACLGGALGLLLAYWGIHLLVAAGLPTIPRLKEIGIDGQALGFTLLVSLLTGVIFGLAPALQVSQPDLSESIKEGSRATSAGFQRRLRGLLVVSEVALALALLIGAGLLMRSFWRLLQVNPGFEPAHALAMNIALPGARYGQGHQQTAFFQQALQRIESLPGVVSAGIVSNLPLSGSNMTTGITRDDRSAPAPSDVPEVDYRIASSHYFRALGIPLRAGRQFDERDAQSGPSVVIINETAARRYWPGEDPVGKRLTITENPPVSCEIVGVVGDVKHNRLDDEPRAEIYAPHSQAPASFMHIVVRTVADPMSMVAAVRREIAAVDKDQPVHDIKTMEQLFAESISQPNFNMLLLSVFAAVALALAAIGVYGVISYAVTQRTHEIGVRIALGARRADVLKMVMRQGLVLALAGIAVGLIGAFALTRLMRTLLFEVSATDPVTFVSIPLLLAAVALAACWIPARRAMKVDPIRVLRRQ
jgi:putative ABC transport system permease protein